MEMGDWVACGWLMEQAGVHELALSSPEEFQRFAAELRISARDRRQTPYLHWFRGTAACQPGICYPSMRALAASGHTQVGGGIPTDLEAARLSVVELQMRAQCGRGE